MRFFRWAGVHPVAVVLVVAATVAVMNVVAADDEDTVAPIVIPAPSESPGPGRLISKPKLAGWEHGGAGRFEAATVNDVVQYTTEGGPGILWYEEEEFADFQLTLEFKVEEPGGDSGVYVRLQDPDDFSSVDDGIEIQISSDGVGTKATGAFYGREDTLVFFAPVLGKWHQMTVRAVDMQIFVSFDGVPVSQFPTMADPDSVDWGPSGYIGLQNHSKADVVRFRDIRITELQ